MVIKLGLWSLPPFLAAGIRFFFAFIILLLVAIMKRLKFPREIKFHVFFIWFGMLNFTGGYALVYWGEQYISSGLASVLFSVMPFYVLFFSIWLLPEDKINLKKFIGVLIGFCGVVLIFWDQIRFHIQQQEVIYGMSAVLFAPIFSTFVTITGKRIGKDIHPIILVTFPMFYASLSFFFMSLLFETSRSVVFDFYAVFSLIYLSIAGTALAFAVYFWMLKNTSAVLMSMITFITPPMALIWGWLLLGEQISIILIIGMIIIFSGIIIVRR